MKGICDTIECLSNSPQRVEILDALDGKHTDLRDLKTELDSPRTTLQRNLSVLEEHGWVEKTPSGYTTTTVGCLLLGEAMSMSEATEMIQRIAPFLDAVDAPSKIDIQQLNDPLVTTSESG